MLRWSLYMTIDWMKMLDTDLGNDPFVLLAGKEEELHLYLSSVIRNIRSQSNSPSNEELSGLMNLSEEQLHKLDPAQVSIEVLLSYIHYLGGDLLLAIKHKDITYQVTHQKDFIVVEVPKEIEAKANSYGMSLNDYIKDLMNKEETRHEYNKQLVNNYITSLSKDVSNSNSNEYLNLLTTRDVIKTIEHELSPYYKQELAKGDTLLYNYMYSIYQSLKDTMDLGIYRYEKSIKSSQWWWFPDVICEMEISMTSLHQ